MEHDGDSTTPYVPISLAHATDTRNMEVDSDNSNPSLIPSQSTAERVGTQAERGNSTFRAQTNIRGRRRSSVNTTRNNRILCPVVGCLEASPSSNRHFRDFASIKLHLDDHCTGQLIGAIPTEFLNKYDYSQCSFCYKIVSKHYHGSHPKCRPKIWTRVI